MSPAGPDLLVLTGFLGTGKTTLLRDLLGTQAARNTAVIVNEVGEIGLDGALLREAGGEVPLAMLANGCICCQPGSDLAVTIEALLAADRPAGAGPLRRIVLETSGLSKPGPILRQIAPLASHRMRIGVVATYDSVRGTETADFDEASAQWAGAHRIVVTKADRVDAARLGAARREASTMNPIAEIVATRDRDAAVEAAFGPPPKMFDVSTADTDEPDLGAHPRITTRLVRQTGDLEFDALANWLDNLSGALGDRLLRTKGLMRVAGSEKPILVQSVGSLFSQPRPFSAAGAPRSGFLVVIARDLGSGEIEAVRPRLPLTLAPLTGLRAEPSHAAGRRGFLAEKV